MLKVKPMSQTHQTPITTQGAEQQSPDLPQQSIIPKPPSKKGVSPQVTGDVSNISTSSFQKPHTTQEPTPRFPFLNRLKKIKNIEIYVAIAVVLIMVVIYMTTISGGSKKSDSNTLTTIEETYVREMETKLVSTLSHISGAGNVKAMVTAVGSATLEIAYNIDERTVTNGGSTTTTIVKTPVIVNGKNGSQPLVLFEIKPQLKGVVIVASGATNPSVRLSILRAVQVLVSDPKVNIEVLY